MRVDGGAVHGGIIQRVLRQLEIPLIGKGALPTRRAVTSQKFGELLRTYWMLATLTLPLPQDLVISGAL